LGQAKLFPNYENNSGDIVLLVSEWLEIISKVNNSFYIFNANHNPLSLVSSNVNTYSIRQINNLTVDTAITPIALDDKILMEAGYLFEKINLGYSINLKYNIVIGEDRYNGTLIRSGSTTAVGETIDIDMSNLLINLGGDGDINSFANSILENYKSMYNRIIGVLTVDIPYEDLDIDVGKWFKLTDTEKFDILTDTNYDIFLFAVARDNDSITFLVAQTSPTHFVGVSFPVYKGGLNGSSRKVLVSSGYMQTIFENWENGITAGREHIADFATNIYYKLYNLSDMTLVDKKIEITGLSLLSNGFLEITLDKDPSGLEDIALLEFGDTKSKGWIFDDVGV
jgi:hypothetical protein